MTATLKSIRLEAASASGKKFYQINICELNNGFAVNFNYGAVGGSIKTGTKTPSPVSLEKAETIFDKLVKEKVQGESHYQPVDGPASIMVAKPRFNAGLVDAANEAINLNAPIEVLPACIPPRLLNDVDEDQILNLTKLDNWWVQIKHDGDRVQLHAKSGEVILFSGRSAKLRACPQAIVDCLAANRLTAVIDGELVGETLWAFDLLATDGVDWKPLPYWERHGFLTAIVRALGSPSIQLVESAQAHLDKAALIVNATDSSAEGVVFINKNAPYKSGRPNRGGDNLRWKFIETGFFIVHSHNHDKGKLSINVALHDGTVVGTCSVIGKDVPPVGSVVECAYLYAMDKLVQCRLKGPRTDVPKIACNRRQLKFRAGIDPKGK